MMNEENKVILRHFIEAFRKNDQETIKELVALDFAAHGPGAPGPVDRETYIQRIGKFSAAFSDLHVIIEQQIAEGDLVTSRLTWRGTHTGEFQGIAPTGKQVAVSAVSI